MAKVYLYSRVSTDQQTLVQQERTVYEWLNAHNMEVDEVVSDMGVSGGVSFADRNLGKVLLPKMQEGDMIIVSEISRLGRSMYDLSKLIHTELKPRKLRLVVVSMGIDLRCDKLSYNNKTKEQKKEEHMKHGKTKNERFVGSKETQAFLKVLKNVFPDACKDENAANWSWKEINTKGDNKDKVLALMKDYRDLDDSGTLFRKWNFDDDRVKLQVRLATQIRNVKQSIKTYNNN